MGRIRRSGYDVWAKTALATFQRIISEVFGEYIPTFMQVFLDDFMVLLSKGQKCNISN